MLNQENGLLKKLATYNHLDFSSSFIDFYIKKDLQYYNKKNIFSFFDTVLTNPSIKAILEDCSSQINSINQKNDNLTYISFIKKNKQPAFQTINITNDFYFSPFNHYLYRLFKQHHFNFNTQNSHGNTPAHLLLYKLIKDKNSFVLPNLTELIKAGADVNIKNKQNLSFIDLWLDKKPKLF